MSFRKSIWRVALAALPVLAFGNYSIAQDDEEPAGGCPGQAIHGCLESAAPVSELDIEMAAPEEEFTPGPEDPDAWAVAWYEVDTETETVEPLGSACLGGGNYGTSCTGDGDCPESTCAPWDEAFELSEGPITTDEGVGCYDDLCESGKDDKMVFPPDTRRRVVWTLGRPWRWIGRIITFWPNGNVTSCTGALVGRKHVLTSGHCVFNGARGGWARRINFSPGQNGAWRPFGTQWATRAYTFAGWRFWRAANQDMALFVLNRNIGARIGWFGMSSVGLENGQIRNLSGYPVDRPRGTQWRDFGSVWSKIFFRLRYWIDTFGGQSGSPVWRFHWPWRWIRGVHRGWHDNPAVGLTNDAVRLTPAKHARVRRWILLNPKRASAALDPCTEVGCVGDAFVPDCNGNGVPDADDIAGATSQDSDSNGIPDECQVACCYQNGTCDDSLSPLDCVNDGGTPPSTSATCLGDDDGNGIDDACMIPPVIPAVTEWGLVVMVLLVLSAGTVVVVRRRAAVAR